MEFMPDTSPVVSIIKDTFAQVEKSTQLANTLSPEQVEEHNGNDPKLLNF
jgi:hypothetical protein